MKYLASATQANLAILLVVMRWLEANGPTPSRDLAAAVRPPALVSTADNALRATLDVAQHVRLVELDPPEGEWALVKQDLGDWSDALQHPAVFRAMVRRAILRQAVRDWESREEPSDVAMGLAWLCSLDPIRPLAWNWGDGPEDAIRRDRLTDVITNATQWATFRRWAIALGFANEGRVGGGRRFLTPDPTTAISDSLARMPREQTAREFLDALSSDLPAIDGGVLEQPLQKAGVHYEAKQGATVGPVVGHSLERLQRRGALELQRSSDARYRVSYRFAGQTRTFDRVSIEVSR